MGTIRKQVIGLTFCIAISAVSATAQNTFPSTGQVGIGTTSPNATLTIDGDGSTPYQLTVGTEGSSTDNYQLLIGDSASGYGVIQTVQEGVGYSEALALQPSGGSVGIGTTAPWDMLSIGNGAGASPGATLGLSGISGTSYTFDFSTKLGNYLQVLSQQPSATPFVITGPGSVGIGTTTPGAKLEIDGNVKLTAGSGTSITFADSTTQTTAWTGVLCGGDYSESVDVSGDRKNYAAGDVLVIDPQAAGSFLKSAEPYSTAVTGIYATKPGVVGRRQKTDPKTSTAEVPMAMIGIVPTRVSAENGPIRPGDLLVTSATLGYAMKGTDRTRMLGAVIGKALGSLDSGTGMIEAVVTLQ